MASANMLVSHVIFVHTLRIDHHIFRETPL